MADAVGGAAKVNGVNGVPSSYSAKFDLQPHFIGGNELSKAPPSKVKDFVAQHDGHTVITKVRVNCKARLGGLGDVPSIWNAESREVEAAD
jgi:acetyl-CoA carboxylase / biotin carboxylase 1